MRSLPRTVHSRAVAQDTEAVLTHGSLELVARLGNGHNAVFEAVAELDGVSTRCVYKPVRGERTLWDFPEGNLAGREVATFLVDQAAGFGVVPVTVLREGPLGQGACQQWIDNDESLAAGLVNIVPVDAVPPHWLPVVQGEDPTGRHVVVGHADDERLAAMALLDAVVNNTDRKASHIFVTDHGLVYGIDHGLTFHTEPKLRTVLWGWADTMVDEQALDTLALLQAQLAEDSSLATHLGEHLTPAEVVACRSRVEALQRTGRYPTPGTDWPALPWPLW